MPMKPVAALVALDPVCQRWLESQLLSSLGLAYYLITHADVTTIATLETLADVGISCIILDRAACAHFPLTAWIARSARLCQLKTVVVSPACAHRASELHHALQGLGLAAARGFYP